MLFRSPFMLLFARNRIPSINHQFYFVTPHYERSLNDKGRLRIDYQSAQPVATSDVIRNSQLLKTLALGTVLDTEVLEKLSNLGWHTVLAYWKKNGLYSGLGYNLSPKQKQSDATFMRDVPVFAKPQNASFSLVTSLFDKFKHPTVHIPRQLELYTPPLLSVPESSGKSPISPKSWIVRKPIVFSKSYYGFSAAGGKQADSAVALLHLITHTELFRYHVLMTSSRMAAERRTFLKETIENFPFPKKIGRASCRERV